MKRIPLLAVVALVLWTLGCQSAVQRDEAAASLQNQNVHKADAKVQADTDRILAAVHSAGVWIDALRDRIKAHFADPAHNPAPTTRETATALDHAHDALAPVDQLGASVKQNSASGVAAADAQKTADDAAIKAATDAQRKADERGTALLFAGAVTIVALLLCERFLPITFIVAAPVAIGVGGIAFLLYGDVIAWVRGAETVIKWVLYIGVPAAVAAYVWARHKKGGLPAWFVNVEATAKADAKTAGSAIRERFVPAPAAPDPTPTQGG